MSVLSVHFLGKSTNWWCTNSPSFLGPVTYNFRVNCAGYTVMEFCVQFGKNIGWKKKRNYEFEYFMFLKNLKLLSKILTIPDRSLSDVTDSSCFNDVPNNELLDCLVFWDTTSTICATYWLHMTTVVFITSSITAFLRLKKKDVNN